MADGGKIQVRVVGATLAAALAVGGCGGKVVDDAARSASREPSGQSARLPDAPPAPVAEPPAAEAPSTPGRGRAEGAPWTVLDGVWLLGWSGGLNHYSWLRFTFEDDLAGAVDVAPGDDLAANEPLWTCRGRGTFGIGNRGGGVAVTISGLPEGCARVPRVLFFTRFAKGGPSGALATAAVESPNQEFGGSLTGYRFARTICDRDLATCSDPLDE